LKYNVNILIHKGILMNVLLTCVGRRNYLVKFFQNALGGRGKVFGADTTSEAPGMQEVDEAFIVPPLSDNSYIDTLRRLCSDNGINLLVSLNDLELPLLSRNKTEFELIGTKVVISTAEVIDICFDKWKTQEFINSTGLKSPYTVLTVSDAVKAMESGKIGFPAVIKPRWGTASIGIDFVYDQDELELVHALARQRIMRTFLHGISNLDPKHSILVQQCLKGDEYGLDIINDLNGNYITTFVKKKLAMRAGETDRAITVADPELTGVGEVIGNALHHVGVLDCDVFRTENGIFVLEMNPRFGGGYPFSHVAGANIPAALIAWAEGKIPDQSCFKFTPGITASKCDRIVMVKG
jgi:carbamoyl-phosphate synthase large subunit